MPEPVQVTICYAMPERDYVQPMLVEPGTTIAQAIARSGVLAEFPEIDLAVHPVGIYAKKKPLDTVLREHDRVEIYRPLVADPKDSRRRRAEKKQAF